jgi:hypothetical protein
MVVEVDAELSGWCNSFVALAMLAVLFTVAPFGVPASTMKANVKLAVSLAGKEAIVQLIVPVPLPIAGTVHVNVGPEFCVSDTKVVPPGTGLVSATLWAASGPLLTTSTL